MGEIEGTPAFDLNSRCPSREFGQVHDPCLVRLSAFAAVVADSVGPWEVVSSSCDKYDSYDFRCQYESASLRALLQIARAEKATSCVPGGS